MFGKAPKVFLRFEIVEHGEFFDKGIRLARPYRVRKVLTSGKGGKFVLDAGGDLFRMLARVLDVKQRRDRITLRALRHLPLRIRTRTVRVDREQREIPEIARYSVVAEVERAD